MRDRAWLWRVGLVVAGLVLALGLAACGDDDDDDGGDGGDEAAVNLRVGYVTTAQHPYGVAVDNFVTEVEEASGGSITFEQLPSYGGDQQLLTDVREGAVEAATVSTAIFDTADVNAFQALQAPFLITNYDIEREVLTGDIADEMLANMERDAPELVGLGVHEGGLRFPLGTEGPLVTPADFDGLVIRAPQSDVLAEGLRALGAEPSPLPITEVYQALDSGTVDGMEANLGLVAGEKFYEVASYFTGNVPMWPFPTALIINKEVFDGLSEDQQEALTTAGDNIGAFSLDFLTTPGSTLAQDLANCGVQYPQATDADKQALTTAGQTAIEALGAADEETGEFISQIQEIKDEVGTASDPAINVPAEAGAECALGG